MYTMVFEIIKEIKNIYIYDTRVLWILLQFDYKLTRSFMMVLSVLYAIYKLHSIIPPSNAESGCVIPGA